MGSTREVGEAGASSDGGDRPGPLVFGLPGNPVSGLVGYLLFVRPALAVLSDRPGSPPVPRPARLARPFRHRGDRPTYYPARRISGPAPAGDPPEIETLDWAGSADLRTVALRRRLRRLPRRRPRLHAGRNCRFPLDAITSRSSRLGCLLRKAHSRIGRVGETHQGARALRRWVAPTLRPDSWNRRRVLGILRVGASARPGPIALFRRPHNGTAPGTKRLRSILIRLCMSRRRTPGLKGQGPKDFPMPSVAVPERETQAAQADPQVRWLRHRLAAGVTSGLVLWTTFPPMEWGLLAWVALAPLFWLVTVPNAPVRTYLAAWAGGLIFWILAVPWLSLIGPGAWIGWVVLGADLLVLVAVLPGPGALGALPAWCPAHPGRADCVGDRRVPPGLLPHRVPLVLPGPQPVPIPLRHPDLGYHGIAGRQPADRDGQRLAGRAGDDPPAPLRPGPASPAARAASGPASGR